MSCDSTKPSEGVPGEVGRVVDHLFRRESARLTASLSSIFGMAHLALVEDVVQDALLQALKDWRFHGIPASPTGWLNQVARNRALDALRREATLRRRSPEIAARLQDLKSAPPSAASVLPDEQDEQLQLMFACCDPRLPRISQIMLTLKSLCGFGVSEIARATLGTPETVAQRLVRAKRTLKEKNIVLAVPGASELPGRMTSVLQTLYLTFNEGYLTHRGEALVREDLISEAIRLTSLLLRDPRTAMPEAHALLALMLFHASRLNTRSGSDGSLILLAEQDRSLWDQSLIQRGYHHLKCSMQGDSVTAYHLEAGIAAVHARAASYHATQWAEIRSLYDLLMIQKPTPVVQLNRAIAISMVEGAESGLAALAHIREDGRLANYFLLHAAEGELLDRLGRYAEAIAGFDRALSLECSEPERRLLEQKRARASHGLTGRRPNADSI
jgi:RNA polymerase sigma-70 factor (ECF subfamily)